MTEAPLLPSFSAIVVAAGEGLRAGQPVPKQFAMWRGKPVLRHSVESLIAAGAETIHVAIPPNGEAPASEALSGLSNVHFVIGGATRQESVGNALAELPESCERVLVHDAARPHLPRAVVVRLLEALELTEGAIPVLPVVDSMSIDENGTMIGTADRHSLRRVQTPQAFRYDAIVSAHEAWGATMDAGDDAQVLRANGGTVTHVPGDERLHKLTFSEDFMVDLPTVRTGMGFDVHRLASGEELWLGGVQIESDRGLAGHSDADVAIHALVDAILGAIGEGDIGTHFPPSDERWKGASSDIFLSHAAELVAKAGFRLSNVDLTIICEAPKIGPHRPAMRARIAELLSVDIEQVSVKATTTERLGFTGRGEGIAAQAIATVIRD